MKLSELTALYSDLDIEYSQVMSGPYEDLSHRGDDCEVIAGLKDNRITGFWRPVVAVGDDKSLKLHIERLYDTCRNIVYMDFLIDGRLSVISQFLIRQGYKVRPYYTQIIDLTKSEKELHADIRKSYKSLVSKADGISMSYSWAPLIIIEVMKNIHDADVGEKRSNETWDIQTRMFENCEAFGVLSKSAYVYINCNAHTAYYSSGHSCATDMHPYLWIGILEAKRRGCKYFELGEQVFSGDEKLVNISKFKRGFGGKTKVRLILEK